MNTRGKTMYKETEIDVEVDIYDVTRFVKHYASEEELKVIGQLLVNSSTDTTQYFPLFQDKGMEGTLSRSEKLELLSAAFQKFSLNELEQRLGTKYDLL